MSNPTCFSLGKSQRAVDNVPPPMASEMTRALLCNARCALNAVIVGICSALARDNDVANGYCALQHSNSSLFDVARTDGVCRES